ncbi:MAG: hypothetical protein NUV81_01265 [bacterium]|nr:hypothetical protein [bacterium]
MAIFLRILFGLVIASVGAFFVIRTKVFLDFFGHSSWADSKFGGGGSNLMYKTIGMLLIFIGFMVVTNLWNAFLGATVGSLFGFDKSAGL